MKNTNIFLEKSWGQNGRAPKVREFKACVHNL